MILGTKYIPGLAAFGLVCALVCPLGGASAQTPDQPALIVHTIKEGKLYWVEGGGGNSGVLIGNSGVVVIDATITPETGRALVAEIAKLTPKPITHLIETHSDADHVNGVASFPDGIKIIAHVNNKMEQLVQPQFAAVGGGKCLPPSPLDRLPNLLVFKDKLATTLDGEKVIFYHFGPAHTTGDLVIEFPDYKVVFTGDLLTSVMLVHPEKHGSLDGWFHSAKALLALPATSYVPGHATGLDTKDMIRQRIANYQAQRDKVDAMVDAGKSLADIKTAMGDAPNFVGCRGLPYPSIAWLEYQDRTAQAQQLK